jgi:hypothetical protein
MVALDLGLQKPDGLVWETGLFSFEVAVSWSQPLSWSLSSPPKPCSALLPPPLDSSPCQALLRYLPKICFSALLSSKCLPADQRKTQWVSPTPVGDQVLLLLPGKLDGLVWHSILSGFPALRHF